MEWGLSPSDLSNESILKSLKEKVLKQNCWKKFIEEKESAFQCFSMGKIWFYSLFWEMLKKQLLIM